MYHLLIIQSLYLAAVPTVPFPPSPFPLPCVSFCSEPAPPRPSLCSVTVLQWASLYRAVWVIPRLFVSRIVYPLTSDSPLPAMIHIWAWHEVGWGPDVSANQAHQRIVTSEKWSPWKSTPGLQIGMCPVWGHRRRPQEVGSSRCLTPSSMLGFCI